MKPWMEPIFQQNRSPRTVPASVPTTPMLAPVIRKIRMTAPLLAPIARRTAISAFFERTSMIIEEMMLKAATRMISVRIRNMTLRSTRRALMKVLLRCSQSNALRPSPRPSATMARTPAMFSGSAV